MSKDYRKSHSVVLCCVMPAFHIRNENRPYFLVIFVDLVLPRSKKMAFYNVYLHTYPAKTRCNAGFSKNSLLDFLGRE